MDSGQDLSPFGKQFDAVVMSYLDGDLSLETAADRLATLFHAEGTRPRTEEETRQQRQDIEPWKQDIERWAKEGPVIFMPAVYPVAPGRSPADQAKVSRLFDAIAVELRRRFGAPS
jgi:hypothetical protein